jgi:hypothetical protein
MNRYGVPSEVLTDNRKQFTGRFTNPMPAEVPFEKECRENGITARLTKPRSPTTTGKIERFRKSLRRELLDAAGPFENQQAAQAAIDAWIHGYNKSRPHQAGPGHGYSGLSVPDCPGRDADASLPASRRTGVRPVRRSRPTASRGDPGTAATHRRQSRHRVMANVALSDRSVLRLDGEMLHTVAGGLLVKAQACPVPAERRSSLVGGRVAEGPLPPPPSQPIRAQRTIPADGITQVAGQRLRVSRTHAGKTVTIVIEDTVFRVLDGDVELSAHARKNTGPVSGYKAIERSHSRALPPSA